MIDLGRMFIKKTRIIGTDYDESITGVEVFLYQRQTRRGNIFLSHRQTPKVVYLMVYKYAP
jgi:hypothetical protein